MNIVCEIPTEPSVKFTADNETEFNDPKIYWRFEEKLSNLTVIWSDIIFPASFISHFMSSPYTTYSEALTDK